MSKEMIVSHSALQTRLAIVEDGVVSEVAFERERSRGVVGNIYKGRVNRVLPGMQSAFVDIGLERDAFLYVSDVLEDDDFLTEECGVDVTTTATGRSTTITATREGARLIEVHAINVGLIATAGDNTFRFRDVGADVTRIEPDGTVVLSIIGQLPFDFTGVLKVNPVTGEVILEPHHGVDTTRACAALTA